MGAGPGLFGLVAVNRFHCSSTCKTLTSQNTHLQILCLNVCIVSFRVSPLFQVVDGCKPSHHRPVCSQRQLGVVQRAWPSGEARKGGIESGVGLESRAVEWNSSIACKRNIISLCVHSRTPVERPLWDRRVFGIVKSSVY